MDFNNLTNFKQLMVDKATEGGNNPAYAIAAALMFCADALDDIITAIDSHTTAVNNVATAINTSVNNVATVVDSKL